MYVYKNYIVTVYMCACIIQLYHKIEHKIVTKREIVTIYVYIR